MSINLIESEHRAQRSPGGAFVSIVLHASLITLAVRATANAGELTPRAPVDTVHIVYTSTPTTEHRTSRSTTRTANPEPSPAVPHKAGLVYTPHIPDSLPPIDSIGVDSPTESLFAGSGALDGASIGDGAAGSTSGDALFASQVEKPALPRDGNPAPKYPTLLESSRVEGSVLARFVVDTTGVVDMRTLAILASTNALFSQSVASALPRWRFFPAEAGGHRVRQLVELPLKFVAPRR